MDLLHQYRYHEIKMKISYGMSHWVNLEYPPDQKELGVSQHEFIRDRGPLRVAWRGWKSCEPVLIGRCARSRARRSLETAALRGGSVLCAASAAPGGTGGRPSGRLRPLRPGGRRANRRQLDHHRPVLGPAPTSAPDPSSSTSSVRPYFVPEKYQEFLLFRCVCLFTR